MWSHFPKLCILPFIQRIVTQVKAEITDDTFKRYDENLFKLKQHLITCALKIKLLVIKFLSTNFAAYKNQASMGQMPLG